MQVDVQDFLRLVETASTLFCWDTETAGRDMDYGGVYTVAIKPYGKAPVLISRRKGQSDKYLVRDAADYLNEADCWVTYYGKGFDVGVMNTRLLRWCLPPLESKLHIDLYFSIQPKIRLGSKSQASLLAFLGTDQQKMSVPPTAWSDVNEDFEKNIAILGARCISDAVGLEAGYDKTKHLIKDIKR